MKAGVIISGNFSPLMNNYIKECEQNNSLQMYGGNNSNNKTEQEKIEYLTKRRDYVEGKHCFVASTKAGEEDKAFSAITGFTQGMSFKTKMNQDVVELYKNNEITYEEAKNILKTKEVTTDSMANIISNIAAGFVSTATGLLLKGKFKAAYPVIVGASTAVGAVVNAGIKFLDRAFNKIDNDALDTKTILKDLGGGAINGFFSGINAGHGKDFTEKTIIKKAGFEILKQGGIIVGTKIIANKQKDKIEDTTTAEV